MAAKKTKKKAKRAPASKKAAVRKVKTKKTSATKNLPRGNFAEAFQARLSRPADKILRGLSAKTKKPMAVELRKLVDKALKVA